MAVPLDQFVKQLENSGILAGDTLRDFIPPKASPKDAEELARELVRKKKLTRFQAEEVYKGKAKSLVLGNYVLLEKIGAGGMGQVFKARHRRMDRIVAVKLLPPATTKDQAAIARFEREVKAAAKISHPNIVAAHDADCAGGVHFLVMEFVEGSDLSALVKKNGPFPLEKAVNYILQAARGLEAAHAEGIVHRDIKPANLLLDKKGVVKILDMGLARLSGDGDGPPQADLTSTGTVMGTVDYMAPEQALDTKSADARADIYSLGCSLFNLLTGKAVYSGDTLMARLLAHREQSIPALSAACPDAPEEVENIFRKMVAKTVQTRYQTMSEVIADLETCCPRQEQSASTHQSPGLSTDTGLTNFLKDISAAPKQPAPAKKAAGPLFGQGKNKLTLIGGGVLGMLILLAGLVVKLRSKDGTLVVTVNESDAEVQVLNEEGKVEITRKGEKGPITISIDPGKHRLKVQKDGFVLVTKDFEIESGGEMTIRAKLVPLEERPAVVGTGWHGWPADAPPPAIAPFDAHQAKAHQAAWAKYLDVPVEYENSIGMKFALIPPGEFMMGSTPEEIAEMLEVAKHTSIEPSKKDPWIKMIRSEGPRHRVVLTQPVYLGTHEVTQQAYEIVMKSNPAFQQGVETNTREFPVGNVSFEDTLVYCLRLSEYERLMPENRENGYRLPTEAEWEFSCRAGTMTKYWAGDVESDLAGTDWYLGNSGGTPHPVGKLPANPFGLFDLNGNVWEWVQDLWDENSFAHDAERGAVDPTGPSSTGVLRVVRGGDAYAGRASECRSSVRSAVDSSLKIESGGFRVALSVNAVRQALKAAGPAMPQPAPVAGAKKPLALQTSGFDQWVKEVAALPAEQQVAAVSKKMVELNPDFDGMMTPTIENGVVTGLHFRTDDVMDLSPVRALPGLKNLLCAGSTVGQGKLSDLSPLRTIELISLQCYQTQVTDFSPIKDMPLKNVQLDFKPARDSAILRSIKTLETINGQPTAEFWKEVESKQ